MDDIILTIYVPTYNHENYIVRALEGIRMQKTKYKYEVLVGEDCSTDNTRAVLKEYEKEHPGLFQIFYRETNMRSSGCSNHKDLKLRSKGKYIMCLEGDDFWTDENKLEEQIDFLENNPDYVAVAHNCVVVGEDSLPNGETYPECKDEDYTFNHFFSEIMPGQFATVMYRNYYQGFEFDTSILSKGITPGDRLLYFALLCHGKVHCIQKVMSAYRHITTHGSSFSANYKFDFKKQKVWQQELTKYAQKHCGANVVKATEYQLFYFIIKGLFLKQITLKEAFSEFAQLKHKFSVIFIGIKRQINKRILHKEIYA